MIELYKVNNSKKSNVKGYWLDNKGKVCIDNIFITPFEDKVLLRQGIKAAFDQGEQAVFYVKDDKAIIEESQGDITALYNKELWKVNAALSNDKIKELLEERGGFTIYKLKGHYIVETWY